MHPSKLRVAAAQYAGAFLDKNKTTELIIQTVNKAGQQGIDLIAFPENFLPGHPSWLHYLPDGSKEAAEYARMLLDNAVSDNSPEVVRIRDSAKEAGVAVVLGFTEKVTHTASGDLYNSLLFIDRSGALIGKHRKLVATKSERLVHAPGNGYTEAAFESSLGTISGLICGENSNPFAIAMLTKSRPVIHVTSWPSHVSPQALRGVRDISLIVGQAVARMLGAFTVNAVSTLSDEWRQSLSTDQESASFLSRQDVFGGSFIADPAGRILAGPMDADDEGLVVAEIDTSLCQIARLSTDYGGHYNRPDVFQLIVQTSSQHLVKFE